MSSTKKKWPVEGLEAVPRCPICQNCTRDLLHAKLTDVTFFVAPGQWDMWRCADCGSSYLDPRPTEATIGLAYGSYYTHENADAAASGSSFRNALGNGFRNWRFGTKAEPANRLGIAAAYLFPTVRNNIENRYRFLPRPGRQVERRLLDFGCGNGAFLDEAAPAGWTAYGVEPDPAARQVALKADRDVRESLEALDGLTFDAITLSHVMGHLHDPRDVLGRLIDRLNSGGTLYIATPNAEAMGHALYGRHWRGLEAPRHLMLFSKRALKGLLHELGLRRVRFHMQPALAGMAPQSRRIAAGEDPNDLQAEGIGRWPTKFEYWAATFPGRHVEFLIATAIKP